jgi:predicted nucleic acid-binding protein
VQDVALDACCLINLLAAGKILTLHLPTASRPPRRKTSRSQPPGAKQTKLALEYRLHVPAKVATAEALYILQPDEDDASKLVKVAVDLKPLIDDGVLHTCDLQGQQETEHFVKLATTLGDGEAICLAVAKNRGWLLGTDDRKAIRVASQLGITAATTPELVKHWADRTKATDAELTTVLQDIHSFARFVPRRNSPLYSWWSDAAGKAKS